MLNTFQQLQHPLLPKPTPDEEARQDFVKSLKSYVQSSLLPGLTPIFRMRAAPRFERETGRPPVDRHDIRKSMVADTYFQHYAIVNRIGQELMWDSVIDSIERQIQPLEERARRASARNAGELRIPARFQVPRYVTAMDIHCMPGGYASEAASERVASGALYDRGVYLYSMGYLGPLNDDMGRSVCNYLRRKMPEFEPRRIIDLGCTVGHSTLPYKQLFPNAEVWGVDVAAPVLRYAHCRAAGLGSEVHFAQMNAEKTEFPDHHFDLVVSHVLLHETSRKAMPKIFKECYRLLASGGYMIHADLPPFDQIDVFKQFILDNETHYNNEPFWSAMRDLDQVAMARAAGFADRDIYFDTAPMAIREHSGAKAQGYSEAATSAVAGRHFKAGEYAPGAGWSVLIARKSES